MQEAQVDMNVIHGSGRDTNKCMLPGIPLLCAENASLNPHPTEC